MLSSFKRELERVRRDVAELASSERIIEARQQARLNELYATAPSYLNSSASAAASASAASAASQHRQQLLRQENTAHAASAFQNPPSSSFISTITTLLHSPKLGARPRSASPVRQQPSSDFPRRPDPFALAPVHAPSPFPAAASVAAHAASSSSLSSPRDRRSSPDLSAAAASSNDPHMQSLWSKGSRLLSNQSSALDASRTKLESLLSQLHHWKATQSAHLSQRISAIEAEAASKQRALVERFEAERAKVEQQAKQSVEDAIRAHRRVVEAQVTELNASVEREFKRTGGMISGDFDAATASSTGGSSYYGPSAAMSAAAPSMSVSALDRSMRLEHLDAGAGAGGTRKDGKMSSDDDESASVRATEKRKRLQYQPAVSGLGVNALSRSHPLSSRKSKPARATASSVLYSSDSEEEDAETRTRRELVEQAQFLHSQRARKREAILSASLGVSGRSQGRSQAQRQREQEALRASAADARRVLESSSDEEPQTRKTDSDPARRPPRAAPSVSFADHPSSSGRAPSRSPTIATPSSTSRRTRRRTDKDRAAAVYNASSEDEDLEVPPPPIEAALARASNGRVQGTPSKHAPSLAQLSDTFQKRIQTIKQPVVAGRPMNSAKREEQKSATVEDE